MVRNNPRFFSFYLRPARNFNLLRPRARKSASPWVNLSNDWQHDAPLVRRRRLRRRRSLSGLRRLSPRSPTKRPRICPAPSLSLLGGVKRTTAKLDGVVSIYCEPRREGRRQMMPRRGRRNGGSGGGCEGGGDDRPRAVRVVSSKKGEFAGARKRGRRYQSNERPSKSSHRRHRCRRRHCWESFFRGQNEKREKRDWPKEGKERKREKDWEGKKSEEEERRKASSVKAMKKRTMKGVRRRGFLLTLASVHPSLNPLSREDESDSQL